MGLGLGGYVDRSSSASLGGTSYLAFLAPGLLAATVAIASIMTILGHRPAGNQKPSKRGGNQKSGHDVLPVCPAQLCQ